MHIVQLKRTTVLRRAEMRMHIVQLKRTTHKNILHKNVLHGSAQKYETEPLGDNFQEMMQPQVFGMKLGIFHKDHNHLLTGFYVPIKSKCFA